MCWDRSKATVIFCPSITMTLNQNNDEVYGDNESYGKDEINFGTDDKGKCDCNDFSDADCDIGDDGDDEEDDYGGGGDGGMGISIACSGTHGTKLSKLNEAQKYMLKILIQEQLKCHFRLFLYF